MSGHFLLFKKVGEFVQIKEFIKRELNGWTRIEKVWLIFSSMTVLALSVYWKNNTIGTISAICGILYVILSGKGKLSSYIFGIVNILGYSYISFTTKYYGEVMLNLIYFLPSCFIGWHSWRKHSNCDNGEVIKKRLSPKLSIAVYSVTAVLIAVYGFILKKLGGTLPFIDSTSTVISVIAQILCIKRYAEQWILWTFVNSVTVVMWCYTFFDSGESIATLLMWLIYLITGIYMYIKWYKESKKI